MVRECFVLPDFLVVSFVLDLLPVAWRGSMSNASFSPVEWVFHGAHDSYLDFPGPKALETHALTIYKKHMVKPVSRC